MLIFFLTNNLILVTLFQKKAKIVSYADETKKEMIMRKDV